MAQEFLDEKQRELINKVAANPLELMHGEMKSYMEEFVRILLPSITDSTAYFAVGDTKFIQKDLTAQTGVYVYEDTTGSWLYCNGAAASQETYAALYAYYGAGRWGADSGGNFLLPDSRGRMVMCVGTHANAGIGDADTAAVADRQAKHAPAVSGAPDVGSLSVIGAPSAGTLAISPNPHSHTETALDQAVQIAGTVLGGSGASGNTGTTSLSITGAPGLGTLDVGGAPGKGTLAVGSGMSGDAPAHLFALSMLVRFA